MINFMVPTITGEEVNQQFSDGMATVFSGIWSIIAPFVGAGFVLFLILLAIRHLASGGRGRRG